MSEVILGQVLTAGSGQNPARQALIKSGIPEGSARHDDQRRLRLGPQGRDARGAGRRNAATPTSSIAGGQENMSASPHVLPGSRDGFRMGDAKLVDTMIVDGLWDVYNQYHMGTTAENVAKQYDIVARAAGRVRGREPEQGGGRAEGRHVQGRDRPGDDSAAQGRPGRVRHRRVHQGRAPRSNRSAACGPRSRRTARSPPPTRRASTTARPRCW